MEKNGEELSVNEVLSSIRTAVLEKQSSNKTAKAKNYSADEDVFVLTKDMLAKNVYPQLNQKEFGRTSLQLVRKYAKAVAAWQVKQQDKNF